MVVHLTLFLRVSLQGREISPTYGIGVAVAAATLLLVSVLASRKLLQRYPAYKIWALAKYTGQTIMETTLSRRLRYTFNGPPTIQSAYDNVSRLMLEFLNYDKLKLREV